MITIEQYFGVKIDHPECTLQMRVNAKGLLAKVNAILEAARQDGVRVHDIDPDTGTEISGSRNGHGDGGFRLSTTTTGSKKSPHKTANGVDKYDPRGDLDSWLTDTKLEQHGLYREHPEYTPGWCHFQDIPPGSGRRTYRPF